MIFSKIWEIISPHPPQWNKLENKKIIYMILNLPFFLVVKILGKMFHRILVEMQAINIKIIYYYYYH